MILALNLSVNIPVHEFDDEEIPIGRCAPDRCGRCKGAGPNAIVLCCGGVQRWANRLHTFLADNGDPGIPFVEHPPTAVKLAEVLVDMGFVESRRKYPTPVCSAVSENARCQGTTCKRRAQVGRGLSGCGARQILHCR